MRLVLYAKDAAKMQIKCVTVKGIASGAFGIFPLRPGAKRQQMAKETGKLLFRFRQFLGYDLSESNGIVLVNVAEEGDDAGVVDARVDIDDVDIDGMI